MRASSMFPTISDLRPVLHLLGEMGYVHDADRLRSHVLPGRPKLMWVVNPMIVAWVQSRIDAGLPTEWTFEAIDDIELASTTVEGVNSAPGTSSDGVTSCGVG